MLGADELPCHRDVTHAVTSCSGFAGVTGCTRMCGRLWGSSGVDGLLLPAACQSTGGSLSVNARQAFCVFSRISEVFPDEHSF